MKNNKSLGQHWLNNREILEEIAGYLGEGETCLEIGPGLGTLTTSLLRRFDKVIAVEYDERLAKNLPGSFPGKNLEVVNEDILKYDFSGVEGPFSVAGNIPYYITSPIIEKVLTSEHKPEKIVLLMQREVAERVCDTKTSVLSLFVENLADAELGIVVPKEEFTPVPKVDSQVLILTPHEPKYDMKIMEIIKQAFKSPRKKLKHNLKNVPKEYENLRPSELKLDDYYKIFCGIM